MAKPTMKDEDLIAAGLRERQIKAEVKTLLEESDEISKKILAEVERRKSTVVTEKGDKVKGFGLGGIKILVLSSARTAYDVDAARKRVGQTKFRKLAHWVITKKSVDACLEAGVITAADVAAFATQTTSAPYIRTVGTKAA